MRSLPVLGIPVTRAFADQARRTPAATALVEGGRAWSYEELAERAGRVAAALAARGCGRGAFVPLAADRCGEAVAGMLGILMAGAAYVPVVPDQPLARIRHVAGEVGAALVVARERDRARLSELGLPVVALDDGRLPPALTFAPEPAGGDDPVYVMYTSGSTGQPKGVVVLHRNLSAYTAAIVALTGAAARPQVFATTATLAADLGNTAVFPALVSGGALRVISYEAALDGALLAAELGGAPIDVLKITPSNLGALLAGARDPLAVLPRAMLICGGEPLGWETVRRVRELGAGCAVVNHYGPTETTVGALVERVAEGEPGAPGETVPIGVPLPGATAYVLDEELRPVAAGETGELYVGGSGVARGYVARELETRARFLADPFAARDGAAAPVMYRTGDRARRLADGRLAFVGRTDGQVKIRGYRVEPGEIEAVLSAHPAVNAVAVTARAAGHGEPVLDAYVVGSASADELRRYAAERLPDYMVPRSWTALAALPLTANGKLDRAALPAPAGPAAAGGAPALSPTEAAVARIFAEVIGTPPVGAEADFFELGGHSLTATIAVASIRAEFGDVELSLRAFFRAPTVRAVAALVDELLARAHEARLVEALGALDALSDDEVRALLAQRAQ